MFTPSVVSSAQFTAVDPIGEGTVVGLYLVYTAVAIGLVIWLGRTLYTNGTIFLRDVFEDVEVARAVNHLLVIGFYLLNLGFALILYRVSDRSQTLTGAVNGLVVQIGTLLLSLGLIHLANMAVFWRIRTRNERNVEQYRMPVMPPPSGYVTPGPDAVAPA